MACPVCDVNKNMDHYSSARKTFSSHPQSSLESFIHSNASPSNEDCASIKDSLSSLSTKSAHLRDIIDEQDEAIDKLSLILKRYEDSRRRILSEQAHVQDLIERHRRALSSPFRKLPIDIMREIFLLLSSNAADPTDISWIASHTCTEWRAIATQTPMLWSKIHVAKDSNPYETYEFLGVPELQSLFFSFKTSSKEEIVRRALQLSGDLPLVISFIVDLGGREVTYKHIAMLQSLLDHAPRWKVAYLKVHEGARRVTWGMNLIDKLRQLRGRVPILESISIEIGSPFYGKKKYPNFITVAPRLSTVAIGACSGEFKVIPWQQIQRLILIAVHHAYFLDILRSAQSVGHLTLSPRSGYGYYVDNTGIAPSIILPAVHTLDLLSRVNSLFLPSELILPTLEKLHVVKVDGDSWGKAITSNFVDRVGELLSSSGCPRLTHATFLPIVEFGPAFEHVIALCSTLTSLDVGFIPPRENIGQVFSFMNQRTVLPALRILKITFRDCNLSEDGPCIGERLVKTALVRRDSLKVFEVSLYIKADERVPHTAILGTTDKASLENLKAEGMSITVSMTADGTKWKKSLEFN
ncbi:hypothetical protein EV421DRAFT_2039228 [Armillaria borealis]|uniref:F-box domain-containing protein n=1 Tax=Armillaria borealis TaxID=47425 RepID=A0AA39MIQ8_9AGAR|nr:hypothetical protein EV421DRAFT_2039228 [Armillaria borealis]